MIQQLKFEIIIIKLIYLKYNDAVCDVFVNSKVMELGCKRIGWVWTLIQSVFTTVSLDACHFRGPNIFTIRCTSTKLNSNLYVSPNFTWPAHNSNWKKKKNNHKIF